MLRRILLGSVAAVQIALTLALLVGAGLLIQTVRSLARVHPGFDTQNILTLSVTTVGTDGTVSDVSATPDGATVGDHRGNTSVTFASGERVKIKVREDEGEITINVDPAFRCDTADPQYSQSARYAWASYRPRVRPGRDARPAQYLRA